MKNIGSATANTTTTSPLGECVPLLVRRKQFFKRWIARFKAVAFNGCIHKAYRLSFIESYRLATPLELLNICWRKTIRRRKRKLRQGNPWIKERWRKRPNWIKQQAIMELERTGRKKNKMKKSISWKDETKAMARVTCVCGKHKRVNPSLVAEAIACQTLNGLNCIPKILIASKPVILVSHAVSSSSSLSKNWKSVRCFVLLE